MEKYLIKAEELWDEFSEHIDDDIDSLSFYAGTSVIRKIDFMKAIVKMLQSDQNAQVSDTRDDPSSNAAKSILPSDLQKDFKEQLEKEAKSYVKKQGSHERPHITEWDFTSGAEWSFSYFLPIIEKLQEENKELRAWKESAISVMPDYQEIGKLLNVPLGQSVHDKIIPAIKGLQQENKELKG